MKVKDLKDGTQLGEVKVKIPSPAKHNLPPRNYYYIYSLTGFVTWVKTSQKSSRVYPTQMMSSQILELKIYKSKKRTKKGKRS
jgi:hypothetical protein